MKRLVIGAVTVLVLSACASGQSQFVPPGPPTTTTLQTLHDSSGNDFFYVIVQTPAGPLRCLENYNGNVATCDWSQLDDSNEHVP